VAHSKLPPKPKTFLSPLLNNIRWHCLSTYLTIIFLVSFLTNLTIFGHDSIVLFYTCLVSTYTFYPILCLSLFSSIKFKLQHFTEYLFLLFFVASVCWFISSALFYEQHGRNLLWHELKFYYFNSGYRDYIHDLFFSYSNLLLSGTLLAFYFVLRTLYIRIDSFKLALFTLLAVFTITAWGAIESTHDLFGEELFATYFQPASAPWSIAHTPYSDERNRKVNVNLAKDLRELKGDPFWEHGEDGVLASLAARYVDRSIIVIMLESFRASDIEELNQGSPYRKNLAPNLSQTLGNALAFSNYIEAGDGTHTFRWGLFSGLNDFPSDIPMPYIMPEAGAIGRIPDFRKLGYSCELLSAANPSWDNLGILASSAGCSWGLDKQLKAKVSAENLSGFAFHDLLLFKAAYQRYRDLSLTKKPSLLIIQALSSHPPYSAFPSAVQQASFNHDLEGSIKFSDYALGHFLDALNLLPEDKKPIIFITSDNAPSNGIPESFQSGATQLESMRVPGVVIFPDFYLAGSTYEGLFCHEDLLDLLYCMVSPQPSLGKFLKKHRIIAPSKNLERFLTRSAFFSAPKKAFFSIQNHWTLLSGHVDDKSMLLDAFLQMQDVHAALLGPH